MDVTFSYIFLNTVGLQLIGAGVDCFYESIFLLFHPKPNDGWLISCIAISTVYFDYGGWDALYEKEHVLWDMITQDRSKIQSQEDHPRLWRSTEQASWACFVQEAKHCFLLSDRFYDSIRLREKYISISCCLIKSYASKQKSRYAKINSSLLACRAQRNACAFRLLFILALFAHPCAFRTHIFAFHNKKSLDRDTMLY